MHTSCSICRYFIAIDDTGWKWLSLCTSKVGSWWSLWLHHYLTTLHKLMVSAGTQYRWAYCLLNVILLIGNEFWSMLGSIPWLGKICRLGPYLYTCPYINEYMYSISFPNWLPIESCLPNEFCEEKGADIWLQTRNCSTIVDMQARMSWKQNSIQTLDVVTSKNIWSREKARLLKVREIAKLNHSHLPWICEDQNFSKLI